MPTTLREELKKCPGQLVKVGMASGFVYIHIVDEHTEADIQKINDAYIQNFLRIVDLCTLRIERSDNYIREKVRRAKAMRRRDWMILDKDGKPLRKMTDAKRQEYKRFLGLNDEDVEILIQDRKNAYKRRRERLTAHITEDPPFLERIVFDSYRSMNFTDGAQVIIVDGIEEGSYWFKREYDIAEAEGRLVYRVFDETYYEQEEGSE